MNEFRTVFALLNRQQKRLFGLLLLMALVTSLLESSGVGLVFLLIRTISNPSSIADIPVLRNYYDQINSHLPQFFTAIAVAIGLFYLLKNAFIGLSVLAQQYMNHTIAADLQIRLLRTYLRAPYSIHFQRNSADFLRNILENATAIPELVLRSVINIATEGAVAISIFIILVLAEPMVTLIGLVGIGGFMMLIHINLRRRYLEWGHRRTIIRKWMIQQVQQAMGTVKDIKVLGCESHFCNEFARTRAQQTRTDCIAATVGELPRLTMETLMVWAMVLAIILIILQGRDWNVLIPVLGLYAYAGFRLMPSLNRMMLYLHNLKFGRASVDFVANDLNAYAHLCPENDAEQAVEPIPFTEKLVLEGIGYSYPTGTRPALRGIDLEVPLGISMGVVGPSGAGKSTLVDVVLGLLEPQTGRVVLDGRDITRDSRIRHRLMGFVPQAITLTDDTLRRNIAFGIPDGDIDDERVWHAVRLALLDEVVTNLPDGLGTKVGERGIRLSGGQRQRVGIARALYHDPAILILDEATSALDMATEQEITQAIEFLSKQKTLIIIAHRLSTVRKCDKLVLMQDGIIAAQGAFDTLIENSPTFRNLVELAGMVNSDTSTL